MEKPGIIARYNAFRKRIYAKRWVRVVHLILQYLIIIFVFPVLMFVAFYVMDYLWENKPGLLFVAVPGTFLTIKSILFFLKDRKIRKSIEEEGGLTKDIRKKIIHDVIVIFEIFTAYFIIKWLFTLIDK